MPNRFRVTLVSLILILVLGVLSFSQAWSAPKKRTGMQFSSDSFQDGGMIPVKYTCQGENLSPELHWKGAPAATKFFAIVCDDPDAPTQTWVHWVIYDIPAKMDNLNNVFQLLEAFPKVEKTGPGILQGLNDFTKIGYDGPCPPSGIHRYYFHLYALSAPTGLKAGASKAQLLNAIQGHILSKTQIMGVYGK